MLIVHENLNISHEATINCSHTEDCRKILKEDFMIPFTKLPSVNLPNIKSLGNLFELLGTHSGVTFQKQRHKRSKMKCSQLVSDMEKDTHGALAEIAKMIGLVGQRVSIPVSLFEIPIILNTPLTSTFMTNAPMGLFAYTNCNLARSRNISDSSKRSMWQCWSLNVEIQKRKAAINSIDDLNSAKAKGWDEIEDNFCLENFDWLITSNLTKILTAMKLNFQRGTSSRSPAHTASVFLDSNVIKINHDLLASEEKDPYTMVPWCIFKPENPFFDNAPKLKDMNCKSKFHPMPTDSGICNVFNGDNLLQVRRNIVYSKIIKLFF